MIVQLTAEAETDLERIADYIAQDNPHRALSFILELRDKCMSLSNLHQAFPMVSRYGVRRRVYGNDMIFYRVGMGRVAIVHILHGSMGYASIFLDESS
jgi:plasmid stabilization system protein ParE